MEVRIYQTLHDKDNPEEVEKEGPFLCDRPNAWLGLGYYFWDTHISLAHWWGESANEGNYIIAQAYIKLDQRCWDLQGNGAHQKEFYESAQQIAESGLKKFEEIKVWQVVEYLRKHTSFNYEGIRALGSNSIGFGYKTYWRRMFFYDRTNSKSQPYLDLLPPVQICLFKKMALSLHSYYIVYPDKYRGEQYG